MRRRITIGASILAVVAVLAGGAAWGYFSTSSPYNAPPTHEDFVAGKVAGDDDLPDPPAGWRRSQLTTLADQATRWMDALAEPRRGTPAQTMTKASQALPDNFDIVAEVEHSSKRRQLLAATTFSPDTRLRGGPKVLGRTWRVSTRTLAGRPALSVELRERHGYQVLGPRRGYVVVERSIELSRYVSGTAQIGAVVSEYGTIDHCHLMTTGQIRWTGGGERRHVWNRLITTASKDLARRDLTYDGSEQDEKRNLADERRCRNGGSD